MKYNNENKYCSENILNNNTIFKGEYENNNIKGQGIIYL